MKKHIPVLLQEVMRELSPKSGQNYIDATLGLGGHSKAILEKTGPNGKLLGIDQDPNALCEASNILEEYKGRVEFVHANFDQIGEVKTPFKVDGGILADIGVSSMQLDLPERGFSFKKGLLDMRMNPENPLTAEIIVNEWPEAEIVRILRDYAEEKFAKRIAKAIVEARGGERIISTEDLSEITRRAIPRKLWPKEINPATKTFQALRIAVNDELGALERFLPQAVELTEKGGKIAVISFHSLEDRIVKQFFQKEAKGCICPPEFPKCVCGIKPRLKIQTKKAIIATEGEIAENPRSRSAKLRVAVKI